MHDRLVGERALQHVVLTGHIQHQGGNGGLLDQGSNVVVRVSTGHFELRRYGQSLEVG